MSNIWGYDSAIEMKDSIQLFEKAIFAFSSLQVERSGFPCSCGPGCANPQGRREFDETEVEHSSVQPSLISHLLCLHPLTMSFNHVLQPIFSLYVF